MRPRGEVRQALAAALEQLHQVRGAVSARDVAIAAQVAFEHARETLKDMARAGDVTIVGKGRNAGERWHNLLAPRGSDFADVPKAWGGIDELASAMRAFVPAPTASTE